jgi:GcrA cell cycle regulator
MPHNNAWRHDWTDARIEQLKQLWADGYSASECAAKLGLGLTRNSVCGKIHRLGLCGSDRKRRVTTMRNPRMPAAQLLKTTEQEVSRPEIPQMRPDLRPPPFSLSLLDLKPGQCRWPEGERDYRFCGAEQLFGSSYCEQHARLSMSGSKLQPVYFNVKKWGTSRMS